MENAKKKRIKKIVSWTAMALVVALLAAMPLIARQEAEADGPGASILSGTVEKGSLTATLRGGGTLTARKGETVELPDSITYLGYAAFYGCEALKRIYIPIGVERVENDAFRGCTVLAIYCEAAKRPKGWNIDWNYSGCPVAWGWNN